MSAHRSCSSRSSPDFFGLVNVNKGVFIVVFIIVFVVLDVLYSLRDISYWGMIPALSSSSEERSVYTALGTFTRLDRLQRCHRHRRPRGRILRQRGRRWG